MKIHLWEAYNPKKISVNITNELKEKIRMLIKDNTYSLANKIKITPARLYEYFIWQNAPIPLIVLINIFKIFKLSLIEIEKNIIMYKQMYVPNKNSVKNPKLPIEINPYLTSIISNLYFDGSVPEDGKGTYYNQKRDEIMDDFLNKVQFVFGDVQYSREKDHRGVWKCRMPRIIGEICKSIYQIDSFGTFDSRISKKIFNLSKEHKIAFILTAILDEGSIAYDGTIMFGVSNKKLCEEVKNLCSQIELTTNKIKNKKNSNFYYFHIIAKSKLIKFMDLFNRKYPLISLRHKEERLRKSLEIAKQKFYYTKDFADRRRNLIMNELKKRECSVNHLSSKYLIPPKTVRRYMYQWMKLKKVSRKKVGKGYYYFI